LPLPTLQEAPWFNCIFKEQIFGSTDISNLFVCYFNFCFCLFIFFVVNLFALGLLCSSLSNLIGWNHSSWFFSFLVWPFEAINFPLTYLHSPVLLLGISIAFWFQILTNI
jgi:hypothetical protein